MHDVTGSDVRDQVWPNVLPQTLVGAFGSENQEICVLQFL